ncbi:hypothetical protein M405DRAFT_930909 [Rhizopogon salebrosus TDB-379]|nr:hypothetical protein M405DRAFT_930909 [Rhizopogon salebrosus TDB-379]
MAFLRFLYSCRPKWLYDVEQWRARLEKCSPSKFPARRLRATCLALALVERFRQTGAPADLDEAIELQQAVVALCPRRLFGVSRLTLIGLLSSNELYSPSVPLATRGEWGLI